MHVLYNINELNWIIYNLMNLILIDESSVKNNDDVNVDDSKIRLVWDLL